LKPLKLSLKKNKTISNFNYFSLPFGSQKNDFDSFIKYEKLQYVDFFKNIKIIREDLNDYEYMILKKIWLNQLFIDKLYGIIDHILKEHKLQYELRFLIIGDLFFSIIPTNLYDHSQFMFVIERNTFLEKIKLRSNINFYYKKDREIYLNIFRKILIGLELKHISKKFTKRRKINQGWESLIFFIINLPINFKSEELITGYSKNPFVMVSIDNKKYCVSSFRNLCLMKRKKAEMKEVNICYKSVLKASQIPFVISEHLYNLNINHIQNRQNDILQKIKCLNFEEYYLKFRNILNFDTSFFLSNKEKYKNHKNSIIKHFQEVISLSILNKNIFNKTFYLPCYMDNRGRQYYGTTISPTFNVLIRYLFKFDVKKDFVKLEKSTFYKRIMCYKNMVEKFNLNSKNSYILLILFIEAGKHFINTENNWEVKNEEIINLGINNFNTKNLDVKFNDRLYLQKVYYMIEELISNREIDINSIIFKDATASGLQNFGILLGYKKNKLHLLNINNKSSYCDTYKYIIDVFLKTDRDDLKKRKYWKKTIMTIPYNSTKYSCLKVFIEELENDKFGYFSLTKDEQKKINNTHNKFYEDVKSCIENEFFENKKSENQLKPFIYYKIIKKIVKEFKVTLWNKRDKYTIVDIEKKLDEKTTRKSLKANNMHYLDSSLIRYLSKKLELLTIHDEFGVRLCELHLLMDEINFYYSKNIGEDTYSIHIII